MSDEEKGSVHRFPAPKGSPTEKFEMAFDAWLDTNSPAIESGNDAEFQAV